MHIAMIASAKHPIQRPFMGGLESHTFHHARELQDRGHRVTVFAAGGDDPALTVDPVLAEANGFSFSDLAMGDPSAMSRDFMAEHHAYLTLLRRLVDRHDIDVVHNASLHYLPIAMSPSLPAPMLTTLHTPPTPWIESAFAAMRDTGGRVVSVSRANAAAWRIGRPIEVVPNGIALGEWPFVSDPAHDRAVWMGRLVPEKGPELAIDACRLLGLDLVLAGPVADPSHYDTVVRPRLGAGIDHVGHLSNPELADLVGNSRVLVATPRWDEPYGLVVAEALACGTPVAALGRGAIPDLLTPLTGALSATERSADLAAAITTARRLDRRAGRRWAEQHASVAAMVDAYERVYREMVRDAGGDRIAS